MEAYKFDAVKATLTISAAFAKELQDPKTDEYALAHQILADFPGTRIVKRTHKTPGGYQNSDGSVTARNKNKNLTYDRMEQYINALPNNEAYLEEYYTIKNVASAARANGYAIVRKWFEEQFPMFRTNPLFYLTHTAKVIDAATFSQEFDNAA